MAFVTINSSGLNIPQIEEAYAAEPSLKRRVYDAIAAIPHCQPLFEDLARYTSSLQARGANAPLQRTEATNDGPATKRRKLQNGDSPIGTELADTLESELPLLFYMPGVSFAIPQRKKLTLEITAGVGSFRARNPNTNGIEFGVPIHQIQHVLCLPVPERAQRQFNFCIIPKYGDGVNPPPDGEPAPEAIVWTVPDGPPKAAYLGSGLPADVLDGETAEKLIQRILNDRMTHTQVVRPDEREFLSATPEAHRKDDKAYHVKAFRGSKEGYIFFLSTGIFFGFKKPLIYFAFENIESISYTSVLQRTFNLSIAARASGSSEIQEFELSMIDQADYTGIDGYIKNHGLQDSSLAETRRAKRHHAGSEKVEKGATTEIRYTAVEEESELQKAQRELEDQEDEEEEDYDPGSEGESDGSGSSSEGSENEKDEGGQDATDLEDHTGNVEEKP